MSSYGQDIYRRQRATEADKRRLELLKLTPSSLCCPGDYVTPTLVNTYVDTTVDGEFQYRQGVDFNDQWTIDFRGHVTGPSDTYAFVLPEEERPPGDNDRWGITAGVDEDGAIIVVGWIVQASTGFVFFTYPVGGGPVAAVDVTFAPAGTLSATDVQAALEELDDDLQDVIADLAAHLADTVAAHAASAVSIADAGTYFSSGEVEGALQELGAVAFAAAPPRLVQLKIFDDSTTITTGDGKLIFAVPAELNGVNLTAAHAYVTTVSSSGTPTLQIRNVTQAADMLSTRITIDASEFTSYTAAAAPVIDTGNDDVATGDLIAIDVDVAGTGAKGLGVILTFS